MKRLIAVVLALSLLSCGAAWADAEGKPLEGRNLVVAMSPDFSTSRRSPRRRSEATRGWPLDSTTRASSTT